MNIRFTDDCENGVARSPRRFQLASAIPSLFLLILLGAISLVWTAGVSVHAALGSLSVNDWFSFLVAMMFLIFVWSITSGWTLLRAIQGRSSLWWHFLTFVSGTVLLGLIGIVGD